MPLKANSGIQMLLFDNMAALTKKNYSKLQFTIVYYSLLYFKTMVLWNFDLLWKTMVLQKKLWYNGQNYGTILKTMELRFKKKKIVDYQKLRNFDL